MQNSHSSHDIDAWLDQATKDLPAKKLVDFFSDTLRTLLKRASRSMNTTTIMAILNRVLHQTKKRYPVLGILNVDSSGISLDQSSPIEQIDPVELSGAFRFLLQELVDVLGNLTADVVTASLIESQGLKENLNENVNSYDSDVQTKRLEALYEVSKYLATFETVEKTFPEICISLGGLFSFKTVLLVEKNGHCVADIWYDSSISQKCIDRAMEYSENYYEYFTSSCSFKDVECRKHELSFCSLPLEKTCDEGDSKYITFPLATSSLETFGLLQFECLGTISESDLRFINALSNLIAVTLDRFNKEKEALRMREIEMNKQTTELIQAHNYALSLEKERELREQFVATLTHDLRTPLTAAKMGAQFILRRPDNVEKNQQLAVKVIKSIDRMDQMIRDLLDANRIRAGESLALTMNFCNMKEIVLTTLRDLGVAFGDRFMLETDREDITGFWNEEGIRRVVENLTNNAVKYGFPQQLITISLKQIEEVVQLTVHNFGNPISAKDQLSLFQPFHRTSSAQAGGKKGWGLGLTLVRGVVEAHGGSVVVKSSEEEGTSFIVTLPRDSRAFQILN